MAMTKSDFEQLATWLRNMETPDQAAIVNYFAHNLHLNYARFDKARFIKAATRA